MEKSFFLPASGSTAHPAYNSNSIPSVVPVVRPTTVLPLVLVLLSMISGMALGDITLVSADSRGAPGNSESENPRISPDGRYVAFESRAYNLVDGDTPGLTNVFVKNVETGEIVRVSESAVGMKGDGVSSEPSISADGLFVAFRSSSTNLVPEDTNAFADVFVKNVETGEIVRASEGAGGAGGNSISHSPSISADGRYVAFGSNSSNLVPGDTNGLSDVFVKNLETGSIELASVNAEGEATIGLRGSGDSHRPSISADGRTVAFQSRAINLIPNDTNGHEDVFVKNLDTGEIVLVSQDAGGTQGNARSTFPSISADGRSVSFESLDVTEDRIDVFVKNLDNGEIVRISESADGVKGSGDFARISADGRFVSFRSSAINLVPGDNCETDVFVKNVETGEIVRVSEAPGGTQATRFSRSSSISMDGSLVAFDSSAGNLLLPVEHSGATTHVYLADVVWPDASTLRLRLRYAVYSDSTAEIFWDRFQDDGTVLYEVTRNGEIVGVLDALSLFQRNLRQGEQYNYTVTAIDTNGNRLATASIGFTTNCFVSPPNPDISDPSTPQNFTFIVRSDSSVELSWRESSLRDETFLLGYEITRNGEIIGLVFDEGFLDEGLTPGVTYTYTITALGTEGERSGTSSIQVTTGDDSPGSDSLPSEPRLRSAVYSDTSAELFWDRATDDGLVIGYEVTRNGVSRGILDVLSVYDNDLTPGVTYTYTVTSIDNEGNRSATASTVLTTDGDTPGPDFLPSAPVLRSAVYSDSSAELFWDRASDDGLVIGYEVTRNGESRGILDVLSVYDNDLEPGVSYLYEVTSVDNDGNRSSTSSIRVTTGEPGTPGGGPAPPAGLRAVLYSSTAGELFWDRAATPGLRYEITRDGAVLQTNDGTSFYDNTLLPEAPRFEYSVVAIGAGDRRSTPSTITLSRVPPSEPPDGISPPVSPGIINSTNFLNLLSYVFDIYNGSADGYGRTILGLPGYSQVRYSNPPELIAMENGPPELGPPENVTCSNGGTAVFTPLRTGFLEITEGWNAEFDNCQDGADVLDGQLQRTADFSQRRQSTEPLVVDAQVRETRFSGSLEWKFMDARGDGLSRSWQLNDVNYSFVENGKPVFTLSDATADLRIGRPLFREITGGFSIQSAATGGHTLRVEIPERLYLEIRDLDNDGFVDIETFDTPPRYEQGKMIVTAQDGSKMTLNADTGERGVAEILLIDGDYRESLLRPWDFITGEQMQPLRLPVPE